MKDLKLLYKQETGNRPEVYCVMFSKENIGEFGPEYILNEYGTDGESMEVIKNDELLVIDTTDSEYVKWLEEKLQELMP